MGSSPNSFWALLCPMDSGRGTGSLLDHPTQVSEAVKGRSRLTVPLVTLLSFSSTQPV